MRLDNKILGLAAAVLTVSGAFAQGADAAANADVIAAGAGAHPWDTTNCSDTMTFATTGPFISSCNGTEDVWFQWTATTTTNYFIDLCGAAMDTEIAVWSGDPNTGGTEIGCNDDSCGLQSGYTLSATANSSYWIQVGYWSSAGGVWGNGTMTITELQPPTPPPTGCLTTLFANNNGGAVGGAVYFDLDAVNATTIEALESNASAGAAQSLEIYTFPMTYLGNAGSPAGWTLVAMGDGNAASGGPGGPTTFNLAAPWNIAAGADLGVAIVAVGFAHNYTNGGGANQMHTDGNLTINAGAADNVPWSGGAFMPRVWNGSLCTNGSSGGGIGVPYCPGVANSTGNPGVLSAQGSITAGDNDVTLEASDLPNNQFGYFLNSLVQGFIPMPGGSQGNLCLSGGIGRYNANVFNTMGAGGSSLVLDLPTTPTPGGPVAVQAGESWNFQCWYRDIGGNSNLTNGLEISFN